MRRLVLILSTLIVLSACSGGGSSEDAGPGEAPAVLTANVEDAAVDVPVDTLVTVGLDDGELESVTVTGAEGAEVVGAPLEESAEADVTWQAAQRLEPGTTYQLTARAVGDDGETTELTRSFTTQDLSLDQQTFPSVSPLQGETVGVGMPVIVNFDIPVTDRALYEQNMSVSTTPQQTGSWYWISDRVVHWRPQEYWQPGTQVNVNVAVNSLPAGNGIYGQQDTVIDFTVGRSVVSTVDLATHTMSVAIDGQVARTIPISAGDSSHQSRVGTKVVMEKFASVNMDAASTGVDSTDPDYYNIEDVKWAMRLTNSGEFVHAAPWSAGSHGRANVSHGCVGMSTANAAWLYQNSQRGDIVTYINGSRPMEPQNGWTDWNVPWEQWVQGSALAGQEPAPAV